MGQDGREKEGRGGAGWEGRGRERRSGATRGEERACCQVLLSRGYRETDLVGHVLGDPLRQSTVRGVEDHLQHVTIHLLHHHVDLGGGAR